MNRPAGLIPGPNGEVGVIAAIAAAADELPAIPKDAKVKIPTKGGGNMTFGYRSSDSLWDVLHTILPKHQLVTVPELVRDGNGVLAGLTVYHADGSSIKGTVPMPGYNEPKQIGGIMSYAARYLMSQIMALAFNDPETEVDAQENIDRYQAPPPQPAPAPEPEKPTVAMADRTAVKELLAYIKKQDHTHRDAFKRASAKHREETGESWSFASVHKWTQAEFETATAWWAEKLEEEPFFVGGKDPDAIAAEVAAIIAATTRAKVNVDDVIVAWNRQAKADEQADDITDLATHAGSAWVKAHIDMNKPKGKS